MFFADILFIFLTLLSHFFDQELQVPGRWGHSNHLGSVLCSAYLAWSVARQVHKEIEIGHERSYLNHVQHEYKTSLYKTNALYVNKARML